MTCCAGTSISSSPRRSSGSHPRRRPRTPQLLYTNTSSLYFDLLADWLTFADAAGASREAAFFHAARPAPFRGDARRRGPVTWFWRVFRGGEPCPT